MKRTDEQLQELLLRELSKAGRLRRKQLIEAGIAALGMGMGLFFAVYHIVLAATGIAPETNTVAIKVPVFSTEKLPQVEVSLGPEMRSTGEVLGVGKDFPEAMYKGFIGAGTAIPKPGSTVLATIRDLDKENFLPLAKRMAAMGCKFIATAGTAAYLEQHGCEVQVSKKISEGVPNVLDVIRRIR